MKQVIFTLASARSGTLYLRGLFQRNVPDCASRHEPFFDWGNPTLFGPAIYDAFAGRIDRIRSRLATKRDYINRLRQDRYVESSHAFLKSSHVAALEFFPDMRLIHLVRDPIRVARSEAYRQKWRERLHVPFHFYRGDDGRRHFCWALTGNEPIFRLFEGQALSLFQWYIIQWIEIENRAMRFLDQHRLHDRCFTLNSPGDLNDPASIRSMFDFLGINVPRENIIVGGRRNRSIGHRPAVTAEDESEVADVLDRLPSAWLDIFQRPPYCDLHWSARFRGSQMRTEAGDRVREIQEANPG